MLKNAFSVALGVAFGLPVSSLITIYLIRPLIAYLGQ